MNVKHLINLMSVSLEADYINNMLYLMIFLKFFQSLHFSVTMRENLVVYAELVATLI